MSYPQGPQQPSGNGGNNNGNGSWPPNPFNRDGGNRGGNDPKPVWRSPWLWGVAIVVLAILMFQLFAGTGRQTIDTKDGMQLLKGGGVTYANIIDNRQLVQLDLSQDFTKQDPDTGRERNYGKEVQFYYTFAQGGDVIDSVEKANPSKGWTSSMQQTSVWSYLISSILPFIIIFGIFWFAMSRMGGAGGMFGMGGKKNNGKLLEGQTPKTKFADVAGEDAAVQEVEEIKDFLKDPSKYKALGARIPRGVLLYGPPGTGKTLLARAIAGEAGVPFYSMAGSDFVEMFVGLGASRVRDLFDEAKKNAPAIIFIDEIDAVGRRRGSGMGGGHDEREQTLNQLLVEMDGFESNDSVVLIAATNRADVLDPALLRPGRFDRQIVVDAPDVKGREKILQVHSKDKPIGSDVDLAKVAKLTPGFTGADLANLMNESALLTARRGKKIITQREVSESMERVIAGPERKGRVLDEQTKHTIAYHESGHALVGHLLPHADPVHKISIISRGRALGYTLSIPKEDKVLNSLGEMRDELAVFMGGRVAEEIFCDDITTGASNDLERATKMARAIVTQYGMSAELGTQVFGQPNHEVFLGRDYGNTQDYSEETAKRIDDEVARIMKDAHDRAYEILVSHREQMDLMASVLLERETVEGEACLALLDNTWDDYLKHEGEINARKEAEEQSARERDAKLADPNWKEEPVEPGDQNPNPPFREPSDEDDGAAAGAQASGAAPAEPADGSKSFLDEMEKGFREMMGDGKGAPQDGKPADRTDDEKGDGERK